MESNEIPYHEQNLWIMDERLTYHFLVASDKQLRSLEMLRTRSAQRGDIVIFDRVRSISRNWATTMMSVIVCVSVAQTPSHLARMRARSASAARSSLLS